MITTRVLTNGTDQTVTLPKEYSFSSDEIIIQRVGHSLILTPKEDLWDAFMSGINGFTDDYFTAVAERPGNTIAAYEEGE